jgi:hypothetical protein
VEEEISHLRLQRILYGGCLRPYVHAGSLVARMSVQVPKLRAGAEFSYQRFCNMRESHKRLLVVRGTSSHRISGWFYTIVLWRRATARSKKRVCNLNTGAAQGEIPAGS